MKTLLSLCFLLSIAPAALAARGDLVSSRHRHRITAAEVSSIVGYYADVRSSHAVDVYEVVYRTLDGKGREVQASGAVLVPAGALSGGVVSVQHGTVFGKDDVPSRLPPYMLGSGLLFAASGYLTVMPDYVGYGLSSGSFHPYLHARSLAVSVVDLLRAARKFAREKGIETGDRLFLTGYSEGGYATMAAQREIEERHGGEFTITASAPMAGPYDLTVTMDVLLRRGSPGSVPYLAYAFWAYDRIYGLDGLKGIVREPYRSRIQRLFGSRNAGEIYSALPAKASALFEPGFLPAWTGKGAKRVKEAARDNGLLGWKPAAPLALFHCTHDTVSPVENARAARDSFVAAGAGDVRLVERDFGDHGSCYVPLILEAKEFFDSFIVRK